MRATNLGFKNPHEIFHAPFQTPNIDYYGRTIQTKAKSRSSSQKPRAQTADRFKNQYTRNYSTNIFLSPHSYNPAYGTIAGDLKKKSGFRYVEETVDTRTSGFYTYVENMKIFNPEVLSPKHQRLLTPMQSKSRSVDVFTGFKRKNAEFINSLMETLEQKVNYEKEGLKAHWVKPSLRESMYRTPYKEKEYEDGTPTTLYPNSPRLDISPIASQGINNISLSTSVSTSLVSTPRLLTDSSRSKPRNNGKFGAGLRGRNNHDTKEKESDLLSNYYGVSTWRENTKNQSFKTMTSESVDQSDKSSDYSAKSSTNLKKVAAKKSNQNFETRFANPKDKVSVISVTLQACTRKLVNSKNKKP